MTYTIEEMTGAHAEAAARLLHETFLGRTEDWQDLDSALAEVRGLLVPENVNRIAVDDAGTLIGWIGAMPMYRDRVWELHPLAVAAGQRGRGIGRVLVEDLERQVAARGGQTLWLGSDDENFETTMGGVDLYEDIPGAIRDFRELRGEHPGGFYLRLGFRITGVLPDANGPGKPDIFFAKRVGEGV